MGLRNARMVDGLKLLHEMMQIVIYWRWIAWIVGGLEYDTLALDWFHPCNFTFCNLIHFICLKMFLCICNHISNVKTMSILNLKNSKLLILSRIQFMHLKPVPNRVTKEKNAARSLNAPREIVLQK